ncbi:MAG TPA: hypothetical protein DCY13_10280, partial [Verrucomicrobiales bacterium]|nr:hypothetical protein [Verrucomicrobiales bacterium]
MRKLARPASLRFSTFAHMVTAVIVAAGRGTRMGPNVDKMFLEIAGHPVVQHTWQRFDTCPPVDHVVVVIRRE